MLPSISDRIVRADKLCPRYCVERQPLFARIGEQANSALGGSN